VLKKSVLCVFSMSAYSNSGHFVSASVLWRGGFVFLGYFLDSLCMGSGEQGSRRRNSGELCRPPEVLNSGGEMELVSGAGQSS
jgi:hypothetical protein